jgi:hypothetical protein
MTRLLAALSMFGSIGAGLYLLTSSSEAGNTMLDVLAHGIGVYFIAKGLYLGASLSAQSDIRDLALGRKVPGSPKPVEPTEPLVG